MDTLTLLGIHIACDTVLWGTVMIIGLYNLWRDR